MNKEIIRAQKLLERKQLSVEYRESATLNIAEQLFQTREFLQSKIVHIYISTEYEVGTGEIIKKCFELGKRVVVPRTNADCTVIDHVEVGPNTEYEVQHFGIRVPVKNYSNFDLCEMSECDLFAVPLVAFDSRGNRIGYGKGCYDRFLGLAQSYKFGLAFTIQKVAMIEADDFDVVLDWAISNVEKAKYE